MDTRIPVLQNLLEESEVTHIQHLARGRCIFNRQQRAPFGPGTELAPCVTTHMKHRKVFSELSSPVHIFTALAEGPQCRGDLLRSDAPRHTRSHRRMVGCMPPTLKVFLC